MQIDYNLNKGQLAFINSKKRECALFGGLGSGKSWALQLLFLANCLRYPKALHCYGSLSYRNMKDAAIPGFKRFLNECRIPYEFVKSDYEFNIGPNKIKAIFRSQETATTMRSIEIGDLFADESAYWDEDNYKIFVSRVRDKNGPLIVRCATTPNGLNFIHSLFLEANSPNRELIFTSSDDNKHLPESYLQMLEESYDEKMLQQERHGQFINVAGGLTYYSFNRERHVKPCPIQNNKPMTIGMDFNVNPMTAVCCQYEGRRTRVVKEFWLENANTEQMGKTIAAFFGGTKGITIIPDSTGNARKTCSSQSDHTILREMGFEIPRFSNPPRKDRFNNINGRLAHDLIEIDPSCAKLIKDLSFYVEADQAKTPQLGHISDAWGYSEWYTFPINIRGIKATGGNGVTLL
jgi:PBSX family phage terminase large subunit